MQNQAASQRSWKFLPYTLAKAIFYTPGGLPAKPVQASLVGQKTCFRDRAALAQKRLEQFSRRHRRRLCNLNSIRNVLTVDKSGLN
jgi:hypothetical protein